MPKCLSTEQVECTRLAQYGGKTEPRLRCKIHRLPTDIETERKAAICKFENCITYASFGDPLTGKKMYCKLHKPDSAAAIGSKFCKYPDCKVQASFGENGSRLALYCKAHKRPSDSDVVHRKCIHPGCSKIPSFGDPFARKKLYCFQHKPPSFIDVVSSECIHPGCRVRPVFGLPNTKKAQYCKAHRPLGFINVKRSWCRHPGCIIMPSFGPPNIKSKVYCEKHKPLDYIDHYRRYCIYPDCKTISSFGDPETKKIEYCGVHRGVGHICLATRRCAANEPPHNYICMTAGNQLYDSFCTRCFINLFPNDPRAVSVRSKNYENRTREHLNMLYPKSDTFDGWIQDKPLYVNLKGGCCPSKRRIDLRVLIGSTLLCVEVDEHQRAYHNNSERYDDLMMDFTGKFIFIRINPHKYINHLGERRNPAFKFRLAKLELVINELSKLIVEGGNSDPVEVYHLYYNGFSDDLKRTVAK